LITDLGIDKNKDMNLKRDEIDRVKESMRRLQANSGEPAQPGAPGDGDLRLSADLTARKKLFHARFGSSFEKPGQEVRLC
jgi:hypothetical protein